MDAMDETETDIDILLECLKDQKHDTAATRRSLHGLSTTLVASEKAKDYFRTVGGLKYVHGLLSLDMPASVLQSVLYCLACAVEHDVFGQNLLSSKETFAFLHTVFTERKSQKKIVTMAVLFFLSLVSNNSQGQNLAKSSSCLQDMLALFRQCAELCSLKPDAFEDVQLLTAVVSALGACVNNPQNESNQKLCSSILPACLKLITENPVSELSVPVLNFISQSIAGNRFNQDRVRKFGGLDTLLQYLQCRLNAADPDCLLLQQVEAAVTVISACITEHAESCSYFVERGGLHLMLKLLAQPRLDLSGILNISNAVGHAMEHAGTEGVRLTHSEVKLLVQLLTQTQDDEVIHSIKYILSFCQQQLDTDESRQEQVSVENRVRALSSRLTMAQEAASIDDCLPCSLHSLSGDGDARVPVGRQPTPQPPLTLHPVIPLSQLELRPPSPWQPPSSHQLLQPPSPHCVQDQPAATHQTGSTSDHQTLMAFQYFKQLMSTLTNRSLFGDETDGRYRRKVLDEGDRAAFSGHNEKHAKLEHDTSKNSNLFTHTAQSNPQYGHSSEVKVPGTGLLAGSTTEGCVNHAASGTGTADTVSTSYTDTRGVVTSGPGPRCDASAPTDIRDVLAVPSVSQPSTDFVDNGHTALPEVTTGRQTGGAWTASSGLQSDVRGTKHCQCDPYRFNTKDTQGTRACCQATVSEDIPPCQQLPHTSQCPSGQSCVGQVLPCTYPTGIPPQHHECGYKYCTGVLTQAKPDGRNDMAPSFLEKSNSDTKATEINGQRRVWSGELHWESTSSKGAQDISTHHRVQEKTGCVEIRDCYVPLHDCITQGQMTALHETHSTRLPEGRVHDDVGNTVSGQSVEKITSKQPVFSGNSGLQEKQEVGRSPVFTVPWTPGANPVNRPATPTDCSIFRTPAADTVVSLRRGLRRATPLSARRSACSVRHTANISGNFHTPVKQNQLPHQACVFPFTQNTSMSKSGNIHREGPVSTPANTGVPLEKPKVRPDSIHVPPSPAASEFDSMLIQTARRYRKNLDTGSVKSICVPQLQTNRSMAGPGGQPVSVEKTVPTSSIQTGKMMSRSPELLSKGSGKLSVHKGQGHKGVTNGSDDGSRTDDDLVEETDSYVSETSSSISRCSSDVYSVLDDSPGGRETLQLIKRMQGKFCPGCVSSTGSHLTSRTFNIAIETSPSTCSAHRKVRQLERDFILTKASRARLDRKLPYQEWKEEVQRSSLVQEHETSGAGNEETKAKPSLSIYNFTSSGSDNNTHRVSPPCKKMVVPVKTVKHQLQRPSGPQRRQRVPYTEDEVKYLLEGVRRVGKHWHLIINSYPFHSSRTAVDIMEKYKRIQKQGQTSTWCKRKMTKHRSQALSMCEDRRLRRGVARLGHNWVAILQSECFAPGRTAKELRERWRSLNRTQE